MTLATILFVLLLLPCGLYFVHGGGRGRVWGLVSAGEAVRGAGAYRETRAPLWKRGSAPLVVRVAALSSFFLGQMIVPGALAALIGIVATFENVTHGHPSPVLIVIQLSAPTGLLVAAYLLSAGSGMLDRADDAVLRTRRAARWALGHNLVLLAGLGVAVALAPNEVEYAAMPALYACFSIAQGLVVRRAAASLEGYSALQSQLDVPADPAVVQTAA